MTPEEPDKTQPDPTHPETPKQELDFPIVGIGASAGGLAAFERLFRNMPVDTGMAFVVIQHLSPPHKSILPEIIQRYTEMPVYQVTDGIEVAPNAVYVIPPSNNLSLTDGHLILLKPPSERGYRFPIDFFFHSLAEVRQSQAIAIVLSGIASDGTLGVKFIKANGGLTIAQEPDTAEFRDMPRNAIVTNNIDYVLPPEKIGAFLKEYVTHQSAIGNRDIVNQALSGLSTLQDLYQLLRIKTGHDFSHYKQPTLLRRIDRRMKVVLMPDLVAYVEFIKNHPEEIDALFHDMLINVTQFFRDPESFEALAEKAIRQLVHLRSAGQMPIRVWIAGCASGEEAYSIAILVQEQLDALNSDCKVQIYATDLAKDAIVTARRAVYADGALEHVSMERLKRFFIKEDDGFHVKKSIRDMVVFSNQNLLFDPPFSKVDLLSCRNLLIYLQTELQKQLFPLFHYALNPGGYLFLGNSETISNFNDLFHIVSRKHKIFQRKDVINEHKIHTHIPSSVKQILPVAMEGEVRRSPLSGLREWTEKELLKYHTPACIVIDEKYNILYIHGRTGKYLEPSPGEASANHLLKMAREGIKAELATAVHNATATKKTVTRRGLRVKTNGDYQYIDLTIRPVELESSETGIWMVVFEDIPSPPAGASQTSTSDTGEHHRVADLEEALKEKDEYLTSIINELEDANQELKSVNEELLSSNEELQSSNEELETSREELQSINEELSTVNAELQNKNTELTVLNNDVYNLLASTKIGTIFVDLDLQLRRFTPAIQRVYNFYPGDVGRPLSHFTHNLNYDRLLEDIQQVLQTLVPQANEVQAHDGTWYLVNIQAYRTLENVIDGAVITFVDITKQKQRDEQRRLEVVLRDSNDAVTVQDFHGNVQAWNQAAVQMYGWSQAEALRMNIKEMIPSHLHESTMDLYRRLETGETIRPFESKRVTRYGRVFDVWVTPSVLFNYTNHTAGISVTEREITNRTQMELRARLENRGLKALSQWYKSQVGASHHSPKPEDLCQFLVGSAGYRMAWVGQVKEGVEVVCQAGFAAENFEAAQSFQALVNESQELVEMALYSKQPVTVRDIIHDPAHAAWQTAALRFRFNAFLILPLCSDSYAYGAIVVYADEPEGFFEEEIEHLKTLSTEVTQQFDQFIGGMKSG